MAQTPAQPEFAPALGLFGTELLASALQNRLASGVAKEVPELIDRGDVVRTLANRTGLDLGVEAIDAIPGKSHSYFYEPAHISRLLGIKNPGTSSVGPMQNAHGRIVKMIQPGQSHRFSIPVAAHEIGHAVNAYGPNKLTSALAGYRTLTQGAGRIIPLILGAAGTIGINDQNRDTKRKLLDAASIVGGATSLPVVLEEALASQKALKMLKGLPAEEAAKLMGPARKLLGRALGTYGLGAAAVIGAPQVAKHYLTKESSWLGTAGRIALGSLPVLGSGYEGLQAYKAFRQGRWGSGLGHAALAGLSAIPGVGILGGIGKGVGKALFRGAAATGAKGLARTGAGLRAAGTGINRGVNTLMNSPGRLGAGLRATQGTTGNLAQMGGAVGLGTMDANYAAGRQAFNQSVNSGASGLKSLSNFAKGRGMQNPMFASPNNSLGGIPGMLGAY